MEKERVLISSHNSTNLHELESVIKKISAGESCKVFIRKMIPIKCGKGRRLDETFHCV